MDASLGTLRTVLSDRYEVERELGRGGMATVYLARDLRHDRQVALKVLDPELAAAIGRPLHREARIAALTAPAHPSGLRFGDAGELTGYAMPFVEGEPLRAS
jgi:serine/threonine-protein kinase